MGHDDKRSGLRSSFGITLNWNDITKTKGITVLRRKLNDGELVEPALEKPVNVQVL